jgi:hypothetical protein
VAEVARAADAPNLGERVERFVGWLKGSVAAPEAS